MFARVVPNAAAIVRIALSAGPDNVPAFLLFGVFSPDRGGCWLVFGKQLNEQFTRSYFFSSIPTETRTLSFNPLLLWRERGRRVAIAN